MKTKENLIKSLTIIKELWSEDVLINAPEQLTIPTTYLVSISQIAEHALELLNEEQTDH